MRLIPVPIIHLILSSQTIASPNLPISSGSTTTPLHVASEIGRADVGELQPRMTIGAAGPSFDFTLH